MPTTTTPPQISIPLSEYLQLRWSYRFAHGDIKEFAVLPIAQAQLIHSLDPDELLCHIVFPDDTHESMLHSRWMYTLDRMDAFLKKHLKPQQRMTTEQGR